MIFSNLPKVLEQLELLGLLPAGQVLQESREGAENLIAPSGNSRPLRRDVGDVFALGALPDHERS